MRVSKVLNPVRMGSAPEGKWMVQGPCGVSGPWTSGTDSCILKTLPYLILTVIQSKVTTTTILQVKNLRVTGIRKLNSTAK